MLSRTSLADATRSPSPRWYRRDEVHVGVAPFTYRNDRGQEKGAESKDCVISEDALCIHGSGIPPLAQATVLTPACGFARRVPESVAGHTVRPRGAMSGDARARTPPAPTRSVLAPPGDGDAEPIRT